VSQVFLEEDPEEGKTAVVIVPDDQLSLAIGREGQNARLAAKLTGWRIDIKSLTEAANESLNNLDHPAVDPRISNDAHFIEQVRNVLAKKQAGRPITAEDYLTLDRLVNQVEGRIIATRATAYESYRKLRMAARRSVPEEAWKEPLDVLDLPGRIHNLLLDSNVETLGDVLYTLAMGDEHFLRLKGLGEKALETVREHLAAYGISQEAAPTETAPAEPAVVAPVATAEEPAEEAELSAEEVAEMALLETLLEPDASWMVEMGSEVAPEATAASMAEEAEAVEDETTVAAEALVEAIEGYDDEDEEEQLEAVETEEEELIPAIDDLSRSLVDIIEPAPAKPAKKKPGIVVVRTPAQEKEAEEESEAAKRRTRKGHHLEYDEKSGEVVVKRKRKSSRRRPEWDEDEL
jgi:N utilization substance protein A